MTTASILAPFSDKVRIPTQHDSVFNEECLFSFDSPDSPDGLYICMEKFLGLGKRHVAEYTARTDNAIFVHRRRTKVAKEDKGKDADDAPVPEKVSRMAIGVPGGFNPDEKKFEFHEVNSVVVMPDLKSFPLDDPDIPLAIQMSAKAIIKAESAVRKGELEASAGTWDGEKIEVSKFANDLEQLDNGTKISPRGWKCERCDLTANLWLNLTDGSILCGRKFFDGSGGNNHALEHFAEKKHPLAAKLGTITADGKADVFSYAEDAMVADPHLAKHLAHFGINITSLTKTDKSMAEIEIDMNQKIGEWATLTESGSKLVPVYGEGYTGLENLGNTCYMNSVLQVLFTLPSFRECYVDGAAPVFKKANLHDPMSDFRLQMCKLGTALWSGRYSTPPTELEKKLEGEEFQKGVRPAMFKNLVGKGHPDFSGKEQQDANEFYTHLTTLMDRCHHMPADFDPADRLMFEVERRVECGSSGKVKYLPRVEDYLPLPIDLDDAVNKETVAAYEKLKKEKEEKGERVEEKDKVRAKIPIEACLKKFCFVEEIADFYSPAIKDKTIAKQTVRFKTFPDYLWVQLKKFATSEDWTPVKLDIEVTMPDELDLGCLKAPGGMQPGEEPLPEEEGPAAEPAVATVVPDSAIVEQLLGMGFDVNGCKKAAFNTNNSGFEAAVNWVMTHMEDSDFSAPFVQPGAPSSASSFVPNPDGIAMLEAMGMPTKKCIKALKATDNNVERAVDWIFSHLDDDGTEEPMDTSIAPAVPAAASGNSGGHKLTDGEPKYELQAFISHMGSSVHVGHYVCHILREGKWVIYNDNKVALSERPPKGLGYLYLYKRKDASSS